MRTATAPATVEDAVRSHVSWLSTVAGLAGGSTWSDGSWRWAHDGPHATVHALFPTEPDPRAAVRGIARARDLGAAHVAVWSATDVARPDLLDEGFELGWSPTWMGRSTAGVDPGPVRLARRVTASHRTGRREEARQPLLDRADTFRVQAWSDGRRAGRAWGHVRDGAAGLYDMAVGPRSRRQGLGTELVTAVLAEAARRGADRITLNATPEGELLYRTCGFTRLGVGRTWWWHGDREG